MHLVALTRWAQGRTIDQDLTWLAPLMGLLPYEARLRLNSGLPVILARGLELNVAQQSLSALRAHEHGAVVINEQLVPDSDRAFAVSSFELDANDLVASDRPGRSCRIPYLRLIALVRAIEITEEEQATETVTTKLALGRAVLTGGLMVNKTVRTSNTKKSAEHQHVVYLFHREGAEPLLLRERSLSYTGLGKDRGTSAAESLNRLVATLRQRAPHMLHDDRLIQRKRRSELSAVRGTSTEQTRSSTNAAANELAAYILVHAHQEQQL